MSEYYDKDGILIEEEVISVEEMNAKIEAEVKRVSAEKDEHLKTKLDEFAKGKSASESKVEEALRLAKENTEKLEKVEKDAAARTFNILAKQMTGGDPTLLEKFTKTWNETLAAMPGNTEEELLEKAKAAATLSGVSDTVAISNATVHPFNQPISGGYAPMPGNNSQGSVSEAEHKAFLDEVGYVNPNNNGIATQ